MGVSTESIHSTQFVLSNGAEAQKTVHGLKAQVSISQFHTRQQEKKSCESLVEMLT